MIAQPVCGLSAALRCTPLLALSPARARNTRKHTLPLFPPFCTDEAARRLKDYGPNQLTPPRKATFLERLWAQINNAVIWILLAAAVVEGAFQSYAECGLVIAVIVINTALGLVRA